MATGALASMALFRVKEGRLLEDRMTAHARAETKRLSYFTWLVEQSATPLDIDLELLKLEYFRRYQLDLQIANYRTRRTEHRRSLTRTRARARRSFHRAFSEYQRCWLAIRSSR